MEFRARRRGIENREEQFSFASLVLVTKINFALTGKTVVYNESVAGSKIVNGQKNKFCPNRQDGRL